MNIQDALLRGLVPAGRPDAGVPARPLTEADFARSYVGYSDLFGVQPTWATFFERLQDLGLQPTMAALSFLNSWLYLKGGIQAQAEIIGSTFDLDLQSRLRQLPDLETRVAYSPAQTLLVMRCALLYSPDRADTRSNEGFTRALTEVLLMANDLLTMDERAKIEAATAGVSDPDVLARAMLSFSIRTTVVNGADAYNTTLARASIILGRLATRDDVRQRAAGDAIDIAARFETITGLTLRDYFAIGWMLVYWFKIGVNNPLDDAQRSLNPQTFFSLTRLAPMTTSRLLGDLMQDYTVAKSRCEQRRHEGGDRLFTYDVVPFMDRPLYQIRHDIAVPANLPFLAYRLSIGAYWILFDSMSSGDRRRWSAFYGHLVEAYVRETIGGVLPERPDVQQRVFPEFHYRVGRQEYKTTDVVGLYPDEAIFFEVTATRFRMEGTLLVDNPDAVEADLERIVVAKARQLHERIQHFREGRYAFGRLTTSDVRSIIPVVVTSEPIPMWTTTNRTIRAALKQEGLLQQSGVEPLHVVGVDELEMLEALVHMGVESIDVLRAHTNDPELKNVSLRNFIALRYEDVTNERLQAEYLALGNHGASLLFNTHLGPATHEEIANRAYELFEQRGHADGRDLDDWLQAERDLRGE